MCRSQTQLGYQAFDCWNRCKGVKIQNFEIVWINSSSDQYFEIVFLSKEESANILVD